MTQAALKPIVPDNFNPAVFSGLRGSDYFLPYQNRWIIDDSPIKIYPKSRRIGITYSTSYRCVRKCLRQPVNVANGERSKFVQWVSSRDEKTALEFVRDYVAMWCRAANVIAAGIAGDRVEIIDEEHKIKAFCVEFENGARIYSLSSNPLAFASRGGDVLLDEFDLHQDQETMFDMVAPCLTWGYQLEIVSAYDPSGSEHTLFASLVRECEELGNPRGISLHKTTIENAIDEGFVEKVNEVKAKRGMAPETRDQFRARIRKTCRTQGAYDSQYMCIPNTASGEQAVRPYDLSSAKQSFPILLLDLTGDGWEGMEIDPVVEPYVEEEYWQQVLPKDGRFVLGYDVARTSDLAAIWIDHDLNGVYRQLALIIFRNCKFESQKRIMQSLMRSRYGMVGAGDGTGMGGPTCEALVDEFTERFLSCNFGSLKSVIILSMIEVFEQQRQQLPLDPPMIALDISCFRKGTSPSGRLIFVAVKNELEPDSHADMATACALAKYAGKTIDNLGPCRCEPAAEDKKSRESDRWNRPDHDYDDHLEDKRCCF